MLSKILPARSAALLGGLLIGLWAVPAAAHSGCGDYVAVEPGDTLYRIASRCGTTVAALRQANPQVNPRAMRVGSTIRMPSSLGADRVAERPPRYSPPPGDSYRVRRGETLAEIARSLGLSLSALIAANSEIDPRYLIPGVEIRLPGDRRRGREGRPGGRDRITVTGTITREGVECPALRGDNGRLYTLAGDTRRFGPGDRVQVRGTRADVSICQQGTTIEVDRIRAAGPGGGRDRITVTGTITREGVECPALRTDNGRLYTLAGEIGRFRPGDRVQVQGETAEVSTCMQGTTISVDRIRRAG